MSRAPLNKSLAVDGRFRLTFRNRYNEVPMEQRSVVHSDPDILGGTPVFVGSRVPLQALIDYIEGGHRWKSSLMHFQPKPRDRRGRS